MHLFLYSWTIKKAECRSIDAFRTVVLEKTLESPLDFKEIKPVHPKGNQSWIFIERTDPEAEIPILWLPDVKIWLWKDPDAEKDWRWEEKGMTEDVMVGWHHWLAGNEFEPAPGFVMNREAWLLQSMDGVSKSRTQLSDWTYWLTGQSHLIRTLLYNKLLSILI